MSVIGCHHPFSTLWWLRNPQLQPKQTTAVLCPVCGCEHVHHRSVYVFPDMDVQRGVPIRLSSDRGRGQIDMKTACRDYRTPHRGGVVVVEFFCEKRHMWQLSYSFHKGIMHEALVVLPEEYLDDMAEALVGLNPEEVEIPPFMDGALINYEPEPK